MTGTTIEVEDDLSWATEEDLKSLQVEVYAICGGGMLGCFAMTQTADFYIDDRVGGLPYRKRDIYQAVEVLKGVAIKLGKDPHNLPRAKIVGAWVF